MWTVRWLCDNSPQIHPNWQPRSVSTLAHPISHCSPKHTQSLENAADFPQPGPAGRVGLSPSQRGWISIPLDQRGVHIPLAFDEWRCGHMMELWPIRWESKPGGRRCLRMLFLNVKDKRLWRKVSFLPLDIVALACGARNCCSHLASMRWTKPETEDDWDHWSAELSNPVPPEL